MGTVRFFVVLALGVTTACQAAPTPGQPCTRNDECAAPLACHFGRCRAGCSANRDCGAGASCLLDEGIGSCALDTDLGCETGVGRECATGLVCVADRCAQICDASQGCATGSVCTPTVSGVSYCAPAGSGLDAGVADAGDAGAPDAGAGGTVGNACVGDGFVCATHAVDARTYCWGTGAARALGAEPGASAVGCAVGDSDHALFVDTGALDALVCGNTWACGHRSDGEVVCWGDGALGQVMPGAATCDRTPHVIPNVGFSAGGGALRATGALACSLDSVAGTLRCWGGENGIVSPSAAPASPTALAGVVDLFGGVIPTGSQPVDFAIDDGLPDPRDSNGGGCFIEASDGPVSCWGNNQMGQGGTTPPGVLFTAVNVPPFGTMRSIVRGRAFTCALDGAGALYCWGLGREGQLARTGGLQTCFLADGTGVDCSLGPVHADGIAFRQIAAHALSSTVCGVVSGGLGVTVGDVYCWGAGDALTNTTSPPGAALSSPTSGHVLRAEGTPLGDVDRVFMGATAACAIDQSQQLWCWGQNVGHQLQQSDVTMSSVRAIRMRIPS